MVLPGQRPARPRSENDLHTVQQPAPGATGWQPTKPIDFLVMAGVGGGADLATRFIIKFIADKGWCPVAMTVRNLPGNSGLDAMTELAKRSGDPHVLMFTLNSFYTAPLEGRAPTLDITGFGPIGRLAEDNFLLWVASSRTEISTIEEFVEVARKAGKAWIMGGTGRDSEDQLLTDFLNVSYDLQMSYKSFGGGGSVAKALAEGVVHSTVNNPSETRKLRDRVKPLVAFSAARLAEFRATPVLRETGMSFTYSMQRSVVGAAKVAGPAQAYYATLFKTLFDSPEWQSYRTANSLFGSFLSGGELTAYWKREREKHSRWLAAMKAMRG